MSLIENDVGLDQIMLSHPSRMWTIPFLKKIKQDLAEHNWKSDPNNQKKSSSYDKFIHNVCDKKILVNLVHNLRHIDSDDVLVTDVVTSNHSGPVLKLYPEVFGIYHTDFDYKDQLPTKKFNCFIHRACPFRQSWFYQFVRRKLLDLGHVSYWAHDRWNRFSSTDYYNFLYNQNNQIFYEEHIQFQDKIPFKNFDFSLEHAIIDSEKTLILETFFEPNDQIALSEKIWRSIQLPRPWLLFSSMHAVKNLREWGFDVFDDVIDHSYDNEPDVIRRQVMILDQLTIPITYNPDTLKIFEQRANHNRQQLQNYQKLWPVKYEKIISNLIKITNNESLA
jgi:hypothetical protein